VPYLLRIPKSVADRIRGVTPPILDTVNEHLALLSDKPRLGTPIVGGPHDGLFAYEFRVNRLPLTRTFTVLYELDPLSQRIDLLDFGVLEGVPPRLHPPSFQRTR
jgi:hypothetical protein